MERKMPNETQEERFREGVVRFEFAQDALSSTQASGNPGPIILLQLIVGYSP